MSNDKKVVFIAAPLFNPLQIDIISRIEDLCGKKGLNFYSARRDSEAFVPKGEDKKNPGAWDAVFNSNESGLEECDIMIAVLSYELPSLDSIWLVHDIPLEERIELVNRVELPDSGTVWEMGYFRALGKIVIGFHPEKPGTHLNLMLTHGCDALVSGWSNLERFFRDKPNNPDYVPDRLLNRESVLTESWRQSYHFNWEATETWGAQNE